MLRNLEDFLYKHLTAYITLHDINTIGNIIS